MSKSSWIAVLALCFGTLPASVLANEVAGRVLWLTGQVERIDPAGIATALAKGDVVREGDVIRAGPSSHVQLVMSDEALLAVRPGSSVRLASYAYRGSDDGSERATIELIKGGLRSVTGAIGRVNKDNYRIRATTHLIGIRGTDHEVFATNEGTYNRVTEGGTYLQAPTGRIDLEPGQVGFASLLPAVAPARLERTPEFMHLAALRPGQPSGGPAVRSSSAADRQPAVGGAPAGAAPAGGGPAAAGPAVGGPAAATPAVVGPGGRCNGPCSDPLRNPGKGAGKK